MYDNVICNKALSKGSGLLKELEDQLSESNVRDLELLGYIENAMTTKGETWKLTSKGRKLRKLLSERNSCGDTIKDWFYRRILRFNVNL